MGGGVEKGIEIKNLQKVQRFLEVVFLKQF